MKPAGRHGRRGSYSNGVEFMQEHEHDEYTGVAYVRTTEYGPAVPGDKGYTRDVYRVTDPGEVLDLFASTECGLRIANDDRGMDILRGFATYSEGEVRKRVVACTRQPRLIRLL